ncbi:9407_t:CDS:2 [Cetraspora pellucida]|uniref:9407_t:CDS:1 n=1 Tax=Cetraspora pellucida TaxID=1433469 RepID=A0ACA9M0E4_9GLOM|nr:9407_t:CDS:2 [Cetraspora pellucida]
MSEEDNNFVYYTFYFFDEPNHSPTIPDSRRPANNKIINKLETEKNQLQSKIEELEQQLINQQFSGDEQKLKESELETIRKLLTEKENELAKLRGNQPTNLQQTKNNNSLKWAIGLGIVAVVISLLNFKMQKKELQKLAQKVQLEIKEEELQNYLDVFKHLEKLLTDFQKVKIEKKTKPLKRIDVGYLTLRDLEKLKKGFSQSRISRQDQKKNSLITDDGSVLFKK